MSSLIRTKVQRKFKMRGYTLKPEALPEIIGFIRLFPEDEDEALDLLLDKLHYTSLKSSILDKEPVQRVVTELLEDRTTSSAAYLKIINAFEFPKFQYDPIKKLFHKHPGNLPIHGDAESKVAIYRDRFRLLLQRISRNHCDISGSGSYQVSQIQSLVGQTGKKWVMGLISQLEDGQFFLEDLTAAVEIDLSCAKVATGFIAENTIVLAEGEMLVNGIFKVTICGFPPLEDRETSHSVFAGTDFFGGGLLPKEETIRLAELERGAVNDLFIILSDVWLDNEEKTMRNLATIFSAYENEDVVPSLFVFMGNFWSRPCNSYSRIRSQFGKLGKMIASHQRLKEHSMFLFIPGPDDIGPSIVLPRCSLPKCITEEFRKQIPNAVFSSNPCRIRFYTQEIVFFRLDMLDRISRSCLMPPSTDETSDPFEQLVATITHQSHLCPLPLSIQPILWNFDHCLHLYPTPHTIVLADRSEQKVFNYMNNITCFNPGSFSNESTFSFAAYRPCSQEVELSGL